MWTCYTSILLASTFLVAAAIEDAGGIIGISLALVTKETLGFELPTLLHPQVEELCPKLLRNQQRPVQVRPNQTATPRFSSYWAARIDVWVKTLWLKSVFSRPNLCISHKVKTIEFMKTSMSDCTRCATQLDRSKRETLRTQPEHVCVVLGVSLQSEPPTTPTEVGNSAGVQHQRSTTTRSGKMCWFKEPLSAAIFPLAIMLVALMKWRKILI